MMRNAGEQPYWLRFARLGLISLVDGDGDGGGDDDADDDNDDDADDDSDGDEKDLGDKGKQALDRMKDRLKKERAARRAAEKKLTDAESSDEAKRKQQEAEAAATAKANRKIVSAELRAAAAKAGFADPHDVTSLLDVSAFDVDDDGDVDADDIEDAVNELLKKKPYLAAQGGGPKPDLSQGGGSKGAKKTGMSALADHLEKQLNG